MATTFVIRNQDGQYLTKKGEWASGKEPAGLYHQPHHDQALNQLIEVNAKDIYLRGTILELKVCEKRRPIVVEYGPDPEQPELLADAVDEVEKSDTETTDRETPTTTKEPAEEYTGFIRPLNVEPTMPKKAEKPEETVD